MEHDSCEAVVEAEENICGNEWWAEFVGFVSEDFEEKFGEELEADLPYDVALVLDVDVDVQVEAEIGQAEPEIGQVEAEIDQVDTRLLVVIVFDEFVYNELEQVHYWQMLGDRVVVMSL